MMTPDVFMDGQFFEVEVENCDKDSEGNLKPEAEVYSRITRSFPLGGPESFNQELRIRNQAINQSSCRMSFALGRALVATTHKQT